MLQAQAVDRGLATAGTLRALHVRPLALEDGVNAGGPP